MLFGWAPAHSWLVPVSSLATSTGERTQYRMHTHIVKQATDSVRSHDRGFETRSHEHRDTESDMIGGGGRGRWKDGRKYSPIEHQKLSQRHSILRFVPSQPTGLADAMRCSERRRTCVLQAVHGTEYTGTLRRRSDVSALCEQTWDAE